MSGGLAATFTVVVFVATYALIATERIPRVNAALGGAAIMAAAGVVGAEDMFFSEQTGIDWNVVFLLLGMMIVVSVVKQTGLFDFLAIWAAKRAEGRPFRIMVMLVVITAVASAFLDNVTTVLLVAPVTILICDRLAAPAAPFLIAEVMASNIGGTATLIGDPPNIIIASRADLAFNDFLVNLAPVVVLLMVVFVGLCRLLFGSSFRYDAERVESMMALDEREAIRDRRMLWRSLTVLAGIILAFVLHSVLHLEPAVVALLGAGVIVVVTRSEPEQFLEEVEWGTLVFFGGLFVMVGALVRIGVIDALAEAAVSGVGDNFFLAATGLLFGSAVLSAIVDNIPYVATMSPLVQDLVAATPEPTQGQALWWSLALGADLGGNATAVGASANVVVLGIAARNGQPISFWQFTRYGLVVATVTIVLTWPYVWLRYFVMG
jgi:Na+/H+ antiporter NhaD/arsenite permease-like protein